MSANRSMCLALALSCALGMSGTALAAQVDCTENYSFTGEDFSADSLAGICVTGLPQVGAGTVMLGTRVVQPGDILTAQQMEKLTFHPVKGPADRKTTFSYLPIYENRVAPRTEMAITVLGREDKAPAVRDSAVETYRNLPNSGKLLGEDPEGEKLTFSLCRKPRRGTVELQEDGTFTYTPNKNKVGVDSFTFRAADPAGNLSEEACVTIQILKPQDRETYADTQGQDCRFEAEWLKNTGLFKGELMGSTACFRPEKELTKGEFLTMLVEMLDITRQEDTEVSEDTPIWFRPYLASAQRAGLLEKLPVELDWREPVKGAEAAVMIQNALDLSLSREALETGSFEKTEPAYAASSLQILREHGISLEPMEILTRGQGAKLLYRTCQLSLDAPGMQVFRMQKS